MKVKNVFTIDTEDWFHANYEDNLFTNNSEMKSTVEENVDELLELFEKYYVKATFFVLGFVAETHPDMIKKIAAQGHEIASHGYAHELVYKQTPQEFREDVQRSKALLENIIQSPVIGYRAPSWSITEESLWALDILEEEGFAYTSSIFPTKNFLYGIPYAPRFQHSCDIYGKGQLNLVNIPPATVSLWKEGIKIPFSGGAYFRLLPGWMIRWFTNQINQKEGQPVIYYLHPREIDPKQPRLKLHFKDAMIHYYGIRGCEGKLNKVLSCYEFVPMRELLSYREDA